MSDSINRGRRPWEEASEHAKARRQAVCDSQADGLGGVAAGHGQQGRARGGWAGSRGVRGRSWGQPLQDLESDELGVLLSAPGQGGRDPQAARRGVRVLGVPTIADRVAQTVVAMYLEPRVEPSVSPGLLWLPAGKSAHDAIAACRQRCWKYDWMIDLDVQKFFDEVPWDLVVTAVRGGHRLPLGAAVCQAVAGCPAAVPGRRPCSSETREPRKGRRFRRSWRTCSCTTRSIRGWPGSCPGCPFERYADDGVPRTLKEDRCRRRYRRMRCCTRDEGAGPVGLVALRGRPAGGGRKPPRGAPVKSRGAERRGKGVLSARQVWITKASESDTTVEVSKAYR